ncbi:hypothetical protein HZS_2719 [Henneguya salminicola]|nr:hypothetical protein HZS_2719 [Henneguya salminicola]
MKEGLHLAFLILTSLASIIIASCFYYNPAINFIFIIQLLLFIASVTNVLVSIAILHYRSIVCRYHTLINSIFYGGYISASFLGFITVLTYCLVKNVNFAIGITLAILVIIDCFAIIPCLRYCIKTPQIFHGISSLNLFEHNDLID